jgi:hypothetical protein
MCWGLPVAADHAPGCLQAQQVETLKQQLEVRYDPANPQHADMLRQLWGLAFPGQDPPATLKSATWKDMGWQVGGWGVTHHGCCWQLHVPSSCAALLWQELVREVNSSVCSRVPAAILPALHPPTCMCMLHSACAIQQAAIPPTTRALPQLCHLLSCCATTHLLPLFHASAFPPLLMLCHHPSFASLCPSLLQGEDPGTDFRGAGVAGLSHLLYLGTSYPSLWHALRHKTQGTRAEWEYPFAVAGLNLTFMLGDLLALHDKSGKGPAGCAAGEGGGPA